MRVVLDTNVIIAAFAAHGLCHLVMETVLAHHELVISAALLGEIEGNLSKKIKLPEARVKEICRFLKNQAQIYKDRPAPELECRDSDDLKILALAVNGQAEALVTGDQDLLVLKAVQGIPILNPRDFWTLLRGRT